MGYSPHLRFLAGLFLPCAYLRKRKADAQRPASPLSDIPPPRGRESQEYPSQPADDELGHAFTQMMLSFIAALQHRGD